MATNESVPSNNDYTPNKKFAVILDSVESLTLNDYLLAAAKVVNGQNIRYASRISGGRICMYLTNEQFVDHIISKESLNVNDIYVPVRRYITASSKIIISNVLPDIPDELLSKSLHQYGKIVSQFRNISIGSKHPELIHIKSFRRVVYLIRNNVKLPTSLNIPFEGNTHTIYLSNDDVKCFLCHNVGHFSRNCPRSEVDGGDSRPRGTITMADIVGGSVHKASVPSPQPLPQTSVTTMKVRAQARQVLTEDYFKPSEINNANNIVKNVTIDNPKTSKQMSSSVPMNLAASVDTPSTKEQITYEKRDHTISDKPTVLSSIQAEDSKPLMLSTATMRSSTQKRKKDILLEHSVPKDTLIQQEYENDDLEDDNVSDCSEVSLHSLASTSESADESNKPSAKVSTVDLKDFFKKSKRFKKILPIISKYTTDYEGFSNLLIRHQKSLNNSRDRNLTIRISRIQNAIKNELSA